jgi:hypothetical protein
MIISKKADSCSDTHHKIGLFAKPNLRAVGIGRKVEVEWNVRELAILIAALITFSAIAGPHEHRFVPQATGSMPPVNVP